MTERTTLMESEAGEATNAVARMLEANRAACARIAARQDRNNPIAAIPECSPESSR